MTSQSLTSVSKATKWALSEFDTKCSDLDLHIRPDKCVSLSFEGSKLDKSFIVPFQDGNTRNISDIGARFLGSILMGTPRSTNSSSSNTLITTFRASLQALNARPICGEYKLWIYQHYLAPSTHFYLAVNPTSANAIKKIEASATKALKKWLKLPRNATQATLYHPEVLNVVSKSRPHPICAPSSLQTLSLVVGEPEVLTSSTYSDRTQEAPSSFKECNALTIFPLP